MPEIEISPSGNDSIELARIRLEHDTRREESRAGILKTVYGTALVGVAVAFFPFAQEFSTSFFAERIEEIKRESEFKILQEQNRLSTILNDQQHDLTSKEADFTRVSEERGYLENLSSEARSESIEQRIILAEFYSFLAINEERRKNWAGFRDHLYEIQEELNNESSQQRETIENSGATDAQRETAAVRLEQIERLINPTETEVTLARPISRIVIVATNDITIAQMRTSAISRGWSDIGEHFIVRIDGSVDEGRPLSRTPAVALNHNSGTVGIGVACNTREVFNSKRQCKPTVEQYNSLRDLVFDLIAANQIDPSAIFDFTELRGDFRYDYISGTVDKVKAEAAAYYEAQFSNNQ